MTDITDEVTFESTLEIMLVLGNILLLLFVIHDLLVWVISIYTETNLYYNAEEYDDSIIWEELSTESYESLQSPSFVTGNAIELPSKPLIWRKYDKLPSYIRIVNKSRYLLLEMKYSKRQPTIRGGPFDSTYALQQIIFKCRPCTVEMTTANREFTLEMQAIHIKRDRIIGGNVNENGPRIADNKVVVIIDYVFQVSETDNLPLQQMISRFNMIQEANSSCYLKPLLMSWLLPTFTNYYYISPDSTSHPSLHWIISPIKQTISKQQMIQFQQLLNPVNPVELNKSNTDFDNKEIFYCSDMEEEM